MTRCQCKFRVSYLYDYNSLTYKFHISVFIKEDENKKPSERFELSTPGLLDQCSNPWATKADVYKS